MQWIFLISQHLAILGENMKEVHTIFLDLHFTVQYTPLKYNISWHNGLKARIREPGKISVDSQQLNKYVSMATNMTATIEEMLEAMFSMWSMQRLHNEDQWGKLVTAVAGGSWGIDTAGSRYQSTTVEDTEDYVWCSSVFRSVKLIQLLIVTSYKSSTNSIIIQEPTTSH